jgi:hypothetical protein
MIASSTPGAGAVGAKQRTVRAKDLEFIFRTLANKGAA